MDDGRSDAKEAELDLRAPRTAHGRSRRQHAQDLPGPAPLVLFPFWTTMGTTTATAMLRLNNGRLFALANNAGEQATWC